MTRPRTRRLIDLQPEAPIEIDRGTHVMHDEIDLVEHRSVVHQSLHVAASEPLDPGARGQYGAARTLRAVANPTDEMSDLIESLRKQRAAVLATLEGLSDEQTTVPTAVSAMPLLGIAQHLSYVERRWIFMGADGQQLEGVYPPDPEAEFGVTGATVGEVTERYSDVAEESDRILASFASGDERGRSRMGLSARQIALHLIEETAAHAGQAAIIREAIDGTTGT
jgi:hypothetical protein